MFGKINFSVGTPLKMVHNFDKPEDAVIGRIGPSKVVIPEVESIDNPDDLTNQILQFPAPTYTPEQLVNMNTTDVPCFDGDTRYCILPNTVLDYLGSLQGKHTIRGTFINNYTGQVEERELTVSSDILNRFTPLENLKKKSA